MNKYVEALKNEGVRPIVDRWFSKDGVCPLYCLVLNDLHRQNKPATPHYVHKEIIARYGLSWRNGFTNALDDWKCMPDGENFNEYMAGFKEGLNVKKEIWG